MSTSLGLPVLWACAIPGTAISAPPASAAAEPVKKLRREVSDCIPDPSGFAVSVMYPFSFFPRVFANRASSLLVRPVFHCPFRSLAPGYERKTGHPRPSRTSWVAGRANGSARPLGRPCFFRGELLSLYLWMHSLFPIQKRLRKRRDPRITRAQGHARRTS